MTLLLLFSCADEPLPERGDCNPVEDSQCLLPFPSSFYLQDGHVAFGPESLPVNRDDVPIRPDAWNRLDGFPTLGPMLAHLPGASLDGAATPLDIERSLDDDSPTVLLDPETGERIPHFAEREAQAPEGRQALILRPVRPLDHGRRYVVAIRDLPGGVAPEGFRALRDGDEDLEPDLERQRSTYEEIFADLASAGVEREGLLLAWDFRTVSEEVNLRDMLHVRDEGLDWEPTYVLDSVEEGDCSSEPIARTLRGRMTVPLYLTAWEAGSTLARDADGLPVRNGEAEVPFIVRLPCSVWESGEPGALLQYGHGVLGSHEDMTSGTLARLADDNGWVLFAVSWTGMKDDDIQAITMMLATDMTDFAMVPERLVQGHLEFMLAMRMMQGPMLDEPELQREGVPLIDPDRRYFYGISQGGILGGAQVAMSPDIQRAALSVPGTPFALILTRSDNFQPFLRLLEAKYDDWLEISLLVPVMQMLWDPTESAGWLGRQDKDLLIQAAIGDAAVTTLSAHVMARGIGASLLEPPARPVWGLEAIPVPAEGSALIEFDWGVQEPVEAVPCDTETNTHGGPYGSAEAQQQLGVFLSEGLLTNPCEGACDPH